MNFLDTASKGKFIEPQITADVLKQLRPSEPTASQRIGTLKGGTSLASIRRLINKTISDEIEEAFKEGRPLQEVLQCTSLLNPNISKESVPSFRFVSEQLINKFDSIRSYEKSHSSQSVISHNESAKLAKVSNEPLGEDMRKIEHFALQGKFMTDIAKLSSILNIASQVVDGVLFEALKVIGNKNKLVDSKDLLVPLKDLCFKTEETRKDRAPVFDLAHTVVNDILTESMRRTKNLKLLSIDRFQTYNSLNDFTVKDGVEVIVKCMSKWVLNQNWFYRMIYHGRKISEESHSLFYTVRWSVPTPSYPVAQVMVDVNFTVEVIPLKTSPFYIEVWYRVETDRSQRCAFDSKFLEKWVTTVVKRKLQTFQMFNF